MKAINPATVDAREGLAVGEYAVYPVAAVTELEVRAEKAEAERDARAAAVRQVDEFLAGREIAAVGGTDYKTALHQLITLETGILNDHNKELERERDALAAALLDTYRRCVDGWPGAAINVSDDYKRGVRDVAGHVFLNRTHHIGDAKRILDARLAAERKAGAAEALNWALRNVRRVSESEYIYSLPENDIDQRLAQIKCGEVEA